MQFWYQNGNFYLSVQAWTCNKQLKTCFNIIIKIHFAEMIHRKHLSKRSPRMKISWLSYVRLWFSFLCSLLVLDPLNQMKKLSVMQIKLIHHHFLQFYLSRWFGFKHNGHWSFQYHSSCEIKIWGGLRKEQSMKFGRSSRRLTNVRSEHIIFVKIQIYSKM